MNVNSNYFIFGDVVMSDVAQLYGGQFSGDLVAMQ